MAASPRRRRAPRSSELSTPAADEMEQQDDTGTSIAEAPLFPDEAQYATPTVVASSEAAHHTPPAIAYTPAERLPAPIYAEDDPDLPYWLALNRIKGIGPARFKLLLDAFGSAEAAWADAGHPPGGA